MLPLSRVLERAAALHARAPAVDDGDARLIRAVRQHRREGTGRRRITEAGRMLERLCQSALIRTADNKEGMRGFREKQKPKFTGR